MQAIGYVRVSTEEQALGPEAQRQAIEKWCGTNGASLIAVHEDIGISGGADLDKRAGLMAAIEALEKGSVLIAAKHDRFARDVLNAALIERLVERAGAKLVTADGVGNGDGPEAALMRSMISAFAAYERALIRSRTRSALAVKKARGERCGQVPFGSRVARDGRTLEPDPAEQLVITVARRLHAELGWSAQRIADRLARLLVPTRGAKWHRNTIARILTLTH